VPFCPMMTEGWLHLERSGAEVPRFLAAFRRFLRPSLWTTFDAEAFANRPTVIAAPTKRLVLIHGRSQQGQTAASIQASSTAALRAGTEAAGLTFPALLEITAPFYGDLLDNFARAFELPLTSDVQLKGSSIESEFIVFQAEVAEAVRQKLGI